MSRIGLNVRPHFEGVGPGFEIVIGDESALVSAEHLERNRDRERDERFGDIKREAPSRLDVVAHRRLGMEDPFQDSAVLLLAVIRH